jgi:hypothetical protein
MTKGIRDYSYSVKYELFYKIFDLKTEFILFDKNAKMDGTADLSVNLYKNLYVKSNLSYADQYVSEMTNGSNDFLHIPSMYKVGLAYNEEGKPTQIYADLLVGKRKIRQFSLQEEVMTASSEVKAIIPLGKYALNLKNAFEYDLLTKDFTLIPEYRNTIELSVTRFLGNDNKLTLGSRIFLIAEIYNDTNDFVGSDPLFALYFSVGITKLFDINLDFYNLSRSMYFGNDKVKDFNVIASIIWYFIN